MLNLDSPKWAELQHAYGSAVDIPNLLHQLEILPSSEDQEEPWFSIWSALAHQGNVYSASFAAVPHVIRVLAKAPVNADSAYFQFPAWVEICRQKKKVPVPTELEYAYFASLKKLPSLVAAAAERGWDANFLSCALAAIAASKGYANVAEAVIEIDSEVSEEFIEWFFNR